MNRKSLTFLLLLLFFTGLSASAQYVKDGYAGKLSYFIGDTAEIFIGGSGTYGNVPLFLFDALSRKVDSVSVNINPQLPVNASPWKDGFGYSLTFKFIIPNLPSGLYSFDKKIFFIIKSRSVKKISIVYPSNTINAYNGAGGKSLYNFNSTNLARAQIVSFLRPWDVKTFHGSAADCNGILTWLLTQPDIDYKLISDMDLDDYSEIAGSQIIMLIGHSEYWTRPARRNFDRFVNNGGNAMVLSGNTMWWQVRYTNDRTGLICYRSSITDSVVDSLKTITWPSTTLNYPVLGSIGCDWPHGAYGVLNPHGWNGYKIVNPNSPILAGTGLQSGDTLSCKSGEYDGAPLSGFNQDGVPIIDEGALGFCKIELIGYDYGKLPSDVVVTKSYGTFIVFRKTIHSGIVVNTAFNEFTSNAPDSATYVAYPGGFGGKDSLKIKRICRNTIDLLLSGRNLFSGADTCSIINEIDSPIGSEARINIFPIPSSNQVHVDIDARKIGDIEILVADLNGRLVMEKQITNVESTVVELNFDGESSGLYLLRIKTSDTITTRRIIITK